MLFRNDSKLLVLVTILLLPSQCFSADNAENFFHGESIHILESAYKRAPPRVCRIVDSLLGKKGEASRYPFNYTIFDGEPGVGKSTLALAVAYKLQWDAQRFGVNDFMKVENRNGTSVVFNNIMLQFEDCDENTVIILEEINHLLMNYDSKHHDTDSSSVSLWLFLDVIKKKSNLFFIGTTNGIGGFPPQLESRFKASIVTITAEKNLNRIKEILLDGLSDEKVVILDETRRYLDECVPLLQGYNARDIQHLIYEVRGQADEQHGLDVDDDRLVIRPEHVDAAFNVFADIKLRFQKKSYKETDVEQRERHHKESLAHHKEYLAQSNRQFLISMVVSSIMSLIANIH